MGLVRSSKQFIDVLGKAWMILHRTSGMPANTTIHILKKRVAAASRAIDLADVSPFHNLGVLPWLAPKLESFAQHAR